MRVARCPLIAGRKLLVPSDDRTNSDARMSVTSVFEAGEFRHAQPEPLPIRRRDSLRSGPRHRDRRVRGVRARGSVTLYDLPMPAGGRRNGLSGLPMQRGRRRRRSPGRSQPGRNWAAHARRRRSSAGRRHAGPTRRRCAAKSSCCASKSWRPRAVRNRHRTRSTTPRTVLADIWTAAGDQSTRGFMIAVPSGTWRRPAAFLRSSSFLAYGRGSAARDAARPSARPPAWRGSGGANVLHASPVMPLSVHRSASDTR